MKKNNYARFKATIASAMILFSTRLAIAAPPIDVHAHIEPPKPGTGELYLKVEAPVADTFKLNIINASGVQTIQINVTGGENLLPVLPAGSYTYKLLDSTNAVVEKGDFRVEIPPVKPQPDSLPKPHPDSLPKPHPDSLPKPHPNSLPLPHPDSLHLPKPEPRPEPKHDSLHVHAHVKGTHLKETLTLHVDAPKTENFTLTIFDSAGTALPGLPVTGGENVIPALPVGSYTFNLKDSGGVIVETGRFRIEPEQPEHVHAHVKGELYGDTLILEVHAAASESFKLTIYNDSNVVVQSLAVKGGNNVLPALPVGHYSFILADENGVQVEKGRFDVRIHPVHTGIHPNPSLPGEASVFVDAPASESFTLKIFDNTLNPVNTLTVPGGLTVLPSLTTGLYYYKVINSAGNEVSHGRILIH